LYIKDEWNFKAFLSLLLEELYPKPSFHLGDINYNVISPNSLKFVCSKLVFFCTKRIFKYLNHSIVESFGLQTIAPF